MIHIRAQDDVYFFAWRCVIKCVVSCVIKYVVGCLIKYVVGCAIKCVVSCVAKSVISGVIHIKKRHFGNLLKCLFL